jgi:hemoglobin
MGYAPHMSDDKNISLYEALGGEEPIRRIVDGFYDFMETLPEAKEVLELHPKNLASSRDKFYWFLVGWMGGPDLFVQRFGHPRLRARHLPFRIDTAARNQWMLCMEKTLEKEIADENIRQQLLGAFGRLADHMRNTPDNLS